MKRLVATLCAALLALAPGLASASVTTTGAGKVPSGGGGTYDPSQSNPIVWLDTRAGKGVNFTSTTVNYWDNQGSAGGRLSPGGATSGSYLPSDQGSLPAVRTIPNSYFISGNVTTPAAATRVILVVAKFNGTAPANNGVVFGVGSGGFTSGWGVAFPGGTAGAYNAGDVYAFGNAINSGGQLPPASNAPSGGATSSLAYHIYSVIISSTSGNQRLAVDGTALGFTNNTSGASLPTVTQPINVGVLPGSENYDETVLQIIAVDDNSTPLATAQKLEGWARCTYGLTLTGGPYTSTCP